MRKGIVRLAGRPSGGVYIAGGLTGEELEEIEAEIQRMDADDFSPSVACVRSDSGKSSLFMVGGDSKRREEQAVFFRGFLSYMRLVSCRFAVPVGGEFSSTSAVQASNRRFADALGRLARRLREAQAACQQSAAGGSDEWRESKEGRYIVAAGYDFEDLADELERASADFSEVGKP